MNRQNSMTESVTETVDQMKDVMRKQMETIKSDKVTDSISQMVGRVEERFGFSKEDALHTMQDLFDTYGDDVLDLIAQRTPLPIKRKKKNTNKKLATILTVAMGVIAVTRWFLNHNADES